MKKTYIAPDVKEIKVKISHTLCVSSIFLSSEGDEITSDEWAW